jgi:ABC-type Fe3+ transport system substrate-binding protein
MMKRENDMGEHSFDDLAKGVADGTIARSKALKAGGAAILGGLLSIFALPSRDADAARRRPLKTLWAVVNINADQTITVTRSKGATVASKLGTGAYKIGFNRNVSGCACVATIDQSQVGFISAQAGSFVATGRDVVVSTYDSNGDEAERPFQLAVHC